jgi:DNA-binding MarR family transcriptional regulator
MWLMHTVSLNEGISSRELAELLDIRPSSLTEMLGRLEADGFVTREKDTQDLRVWRISLTAEGKKLLAEEAAAWLAHDDFSDILTKEETATFLELCSKLSSGLEKKYSPEGDRAQPASSGPCGAPMPYGGPFAKPEKPGSSGAPASWHPGKLGGPFGGGMWPPIGHDNWDNEKGGAF